MLVRVSSVGSVSGEPNDFHCFLAAWVWASLDLSVLPSRPRLLVLHDLGASFRFPSSCLTEEMA